MNENYRANDDIKIIEKIDIHSKDPNVEKLREKN